MQTCIFGASGARGYFGYGCCVATFFKHVPNGPRLNHVMYFSIPLCTMVFKLKKGNTPMGKYIFKVPVEGFEFYVVEAESSEAAWNKLNMDGEIPETSIEPRLTFLDDFELYEVLEPGVGDED